MIGSQLPSWIPSDKPSAGKLNRLATELAKATRHFVDKPDEQMAGGAGFAKRFVPPVGLWVKLKDRNGNPYYDDASKSYSWIEQYQFVRGEDGKYVFLDTIDGLDGFAGKSGAAHEVNEVVVPEDTVVWLTLGYDNEWVFQFGIGGKFPAKLTARTAITNPGWGASALTGIFDWVEMELREDGIWVVKTDGRTGYYELGTGCVEMQFTNHALEYGTKIVWLEPILRDNDSISRVGGGWSYVFDEAHTNVL